MIYILEYINWAVVYQHLFQVRGPIIRLQVLLQFPPAEGVHSSGGTS